MTDKKQIEEMAKDIAEVKHALHCVIPPFEKTIDDLMAEKLYKLGYRKIPEDSVVFIPTDEQYVLLTKEEYNRACSRERVIVDLKGIIEVIIEVEEKIRKETAREILDKVDKESNGQTKQITDLLRKQYGVEVEEEG